MFPGTLEFAKWIQPWHIIKIIVIVCNFLKYNIKYDILKGYFSKCELLPFRGGNYIGNNMNFCWQRWESNLIQSAFSSFLGVAKDNWMLIKACISEMCY